MTDIDYSGPEYTSTSFDELPHSDDWADATSKDETMEQPDEASLAYLRNVEIQLNQRYYDEDVQQYVRERADGSSSD